MKLFDVFAVVAPDVTPQESKIHLAGWNGLDDPLDVYLAGNFNTWQSWQSKRNFGRKYVISLISMGGSRWLFAGIYEVQGAEWISDEPAHFMYDLAEDPRGAELNGRLIVSHDREGRQSYRNAESIASEISVQELRPSRLSVQRFPGFKSILLTKLQLETIFKENHESWRTALSSVAGVYLISDSKTGKLYVGSATGEGGIWARWSAYAATGHGENAELRKLLAIEGPGRASSFQYSVLEIADTHASSEDVLLRESHWKNVLLSRSHGLNAN